MAWSSELEPVSTTASRSGCCSAPRAGSRGHRRPEADVHDEDVRRRVPRARRPPTGRADASGLASEVLDRRSRGLAEGRVVFDDERLHRPPGLREAPPALLEELEGLERARAAPVESVDGILAFRRPPARRLEVERDGRQRRRDVMEEAAQPRRTRWSSQVAWNSILSRLRGLAPRRRKKGPAETGPLGFETFGRPIRPSRCSARSP